MKNLLLTMVICSMLTSCSKTFIQVYDTATTNTVFQDNLFVYETDTVRITYFFWANKGVMSFAVFNKLDKPIYIDWKNSSFIHNDNKFNYWIEETKTNVSSYYGGYFYNGPILKSGYTLNEGIQNASSTTVKLERTTFIPPKSNYYRSQFYLLPVGYYKLSDKHQTEIVSRNDNPKKKTSVYSEKFSVSNSPLRFRNYLALTFSENSQQFVFIDNEFYMNSVKEMDYRHYNGKLIRIAENGSWEFEIPYTKRTSFYNKIDLDKSVEYRDMLSKHYNSAK